MLQGEYFVQRRRATLWLSVTAAMNLELMIYQCRAHNLYRSLDPFTEILRQHSEVNALSRDAELRSD